MINKTVGTFLLGGMLTLGMAASIGLAQQTAGQTGQGEHGRHQMDADAQLKHLTKALDLTADQQTQIKPILAARDQQRQQIFADQSLAEQDRHTKMKAMHEDTKAKITALLNDTQKQKFEAMQSRHEGHGGKQGGTGSVSQ